MEFGWILGGIFVFVTMLFIAVAFFLPEWVGITGAKARQNIKEHEAEEASKPSSDSP